MSYFPVLFQYSVLVKGTQVRIQRLMQALACQCLGHVRNSDNANAVQPSTVRPSVQHSIGKSRLNRMPWVTDKRLALRANNQQSAKCP